MIGAICQHNITWENISALRRSDPNKYSGLLYEFIQQYVVENNEKDYICSSCGFQLNIKKYTTDISFDDDTQKPILFGIPLEVHLEDIPEYEKFKITISNWRCSK